MRNIAKVVIPLAAGLLALALMGCQVPAAAPTPTAPKPAVEKPAAPTPKPAVEKPAAPTPKPAVEKPVEKPKEKLRLKDGSTNTASSYYIYAVAEAKFLNAAVPEVDITVAESGGTDDNLKRLARKEFQMSSVVGTGVGYQAYHGLGTWKDKALSDLRILWNYTVGARVVIVTEESGIKTLEELKGKKINPGMTGSATEKDFKAHMEIVGIKPDYYPGGTEDAVTAIKDRAIPGYVKSQAGVMVDASTMDLMTFIKIRPLGYTDEHIKKISEKRPWDVWLTIKQDEWYKGAPAFNTLASVLSTATLKDNIPNDIAYKMAKALNEKGEADIAIAAKFMKGWKYAGRTAELANLPIHAGVVKYLRELGLKLEPHQIPPEAK